MNGRHLESFFFHADSSSFDSRGFFWVKRGSQHFTEYFNRQSKYMPILEQLQTEMKHHCYAGSLLVFLVVAWFYCLKYTVFLAILVFLAVIGLETTSANHQN